MTFMLTAQVAADTRLFLAVGGAAPMFSGPGFHGGQQPYRYKHFGGPPSHSFNSWFMGVVIYGGYLFHDGGFSPFGDHFGTGDPYHSGPGFYQMAVFHSFHDNGFRDTFDDPVYLF